MLTARRKEKMELNERKMKILKAVVKDYIETAEAVDLEQFRKSIILELALLL